MTKKTSFLAGISHDLGTLVTRIKLRLELLEDKKGIIDIKKDIDIMQVFLKEYLEYSKQINVSRFTKINMLQTINQVIELSKLKKKKLILNAQKIYLLKQIKIHYLE